MMKTFFTIIAFSVLALQQVAIQAQTLESPNVGNVISVENGMTLTLLVGDKKIQTLLLAVGAPTQAFGKESRENLKRLVLNRQVKLLAIKLGSEGEKKETTIGKVILDNLDIGLEQVRSGFAWYSPEQEQYQIPEDRKLYTEAEQDAKQNKRGIWSDSFKDCKGATVETNINSASRIGAEGGKKLKVYGTAMVKVTIDESGKVISAQGLCGHPVLQTSAVEAALKWKFKPVGPKIIGTLTFNFVP